MVLNPDLPDGWKEMAFTFTFQDIRYHAILDADQLRIKHDAENPQQMQIAGESLDLEGGSWHTVAL
jgi:trehalose/maltose hydrolase-like predicted phosphorylase